MASSSSGQIMEIPDDEPPAEEEKKQPVEERKAEKSPEEPAPAAIVKRKVPGRALYAIVVVLLLVLPGTYLALKTFNLGGPGGGGGSNGSSDDHWDVYMELAKGQTRKISGQRLDIVGDILVPRGSTLEFSGCDIAMNGTFYVGGKLSLVSTSLRDRSANPSITHYGGRYYPLRIPLNLIGCSSAAFRFSSEYSIPAAGAIRVAVEDNGSIVNTSTLLTGHSDGEVDVSVDLTPYCGREIVLKLGPEYAGNGVYVGIALWNMTLATNDGNFPVDMEQASLGDDWNQHIHLDGFHFAVMGGSLVLDRGRLLCLGFREEVIDIHEGKLKAAGCSLAIEEQDSGNGYGDSRWVDGVNATIEFEGSDLVNGSGLDAVDSTVALTDSTICNGTTAILVANSDLRVERCNLEHFYQGIVALRQQSPAVPVRLEVNGTHINASNTAIRLDGVRADIENSTILGGENPLRVYPPAFLIRENCTFENVVRMVNNVINSTPQWYNPQLHPLIDIYSSIPVTGLDTLLKANSFGSPNIYARHLVTDIGSQRSDDQQYYNDTGTEELYTAGLEPESERPFSDGWSYIDSIYDSPWEYNDFYTPLGSIVVERATQVEGGYSVKRLDESAISIKHVGSDGIGFGTFDASALRNPSDVPVIEVPVMEMCDLSIYDLSMYYNAPYYLLNLTFQVLTTGKRFDDFQLTCTIGNMTMYRIERAGDGGFEMSIDGRRIREGSELVVRAEPIGVVDADLSNNMLRSNVTLVTASRVLTGPVNLSGTWFLSEGVELAFQNCTVFSCETQVSILGMGSNRLDIDNSSLDCAYLQIKVDDVCIRSTVLNISHQVVYSEYYAYSIEGIDNLTLEDVSCGYRAAEYGALPAGERQAFLEGLMTDPVLAEGYPFAYAYVIIDGGNITMANSTFLLCAYIGISGGDVCVTGSRFAVGEHLVVEAGNLSFSSSELRQLVYASFGAGNMSMEGNDLVSVSYGVYLACQYGNSTFAHNKVVWASSKYGDGAVTLNGPEPPLMVNNTFSNMPVAIALRCDGDPRRLVAGNSFENISGHLVSVQKELRVELASELVRSTTGEEPDEVHIEYQELHGSETSNAWLGTSEARPNATVFSCTFYPFVMGIDPNGTVEELTELRIEVSIEYDEAAARHDIIRDIPVRPEYSWTEYFE